MGTFLGLLLVICALFGASAANPCLDPTDADYRCEVDEEGYLDLGECGITDEDVEGGDLAACLDNAGRDLVVELSLYLNSLTTLPAGIFDGLTAVETLGLVDNALTTLPAGIFGGLTTLDFITFGGNALTTLPAGIFEDTTVLSTLNMRGNSFTTLPAGIFDGLTGLQGLSMYENPITTLPDGIFDDLTSLGRLFLYETALSSLPDGIFENLTALERIRLDYSNYTTLPAGIFEGLTSLTSITLAGNPVTTLPAGIFEGLTAMEYLYIASWHVLTSYSRSHPATPLNRYLYDMGLTTLPVGIFDGLTAVINLHLDDNALTTLPTGIFDGFTALEELHLDNNNLTTLQAGIFEVHTALEDLNLRGNSLECLPTVPSTLVEVDDDGGSFPDGLHVDQYGDLCGCSIPDVTDNVCDPYDCTPGAEGYTCAPTVAPAAITPAPGAITPAPGAITPAPALEIATPAAATTAPVPATAAPEGSGVTAGEGNYTPSPSPPFGITATLSPVSALPEQKSASDSTPIVAGVLSAVAGAALIALAVCQRRRRGSNQKTTLTSAVPPFHEDGNVERGREAPLDASAPPYSAVVAVGNGDEKPPPYQGHPSPRRPTPADIGAAGSEGIVPPPASVALDGQVQPSAGHAENAAGGGSSARRASDGSAEKLSAVATISTATLSTAERDEVSRFHQGELEAAPVSGGPGREEASSGGGPGASAAADRQSPADIGLGRAVLAAAQELAHHCQIPGVSEAANAVLMIMNLVTDSRDNARASELRLRQCSTVVLALKRAAKVADKGGDTIGAVAHGMIEDVHGAVFDLVQLITTYQSKNKLSRVFMSTLFKRRQEELDAVVDQAIMRLQLGLQLQVGQDVGAVKDNVHSLKEGMDVYQLSLSEAASESVAEARRLKRQRKLDQVEIPAEYLSITDELLGQGGFGEVYLADYNGHNAAAKVLHIAKTGALDENQKQQESRQHKAFLRELEAMMRLRSLNTVNVYGAVTSLPDRMVLVMELLAGGDLLTLLRKSKKPLPEGQSRRIIRDICTGMAFLHSKSTVHGDLKSANVLLDGDGRAKIADFGTSRWTTNSTGLATYTTKSSQTTQMSIAWSA
ncbi:unnamed protein product, partial [Ectocarpus fasciculatus]